MNEISESKQSIKLSIKFIAIQNDIKQIVWWIPLWFVECLTNERQKYVNKAKVVWNLRPKGIIRFKDNLCYLGIDSTGSQEKISHASHNNDNVSGFDSELVDNWTQKMTKSRVWSHFLSNIIIMRTTFLRFSSVHKIKEKVQRMQFIEKSKKSEISSMS